MRRRLAIASLVVLSISASPPAALAAAEDSSPMPPTAILERAFRARYDCDLRMTVDLRVKTPDQHVLARRLDVVTKLIADRLHTLAVFTEPAELRRTKLLTMESAERDDDQFIYLPSLRRVRRVSSAQRGDAFMGTDLAYEDFERRRAADYDPELAPGPPAPPGQGEPVWLVSARPHFESSYERVEFVIAQRDWAILASRYFKRGATTPFKQATMPRRGFRSGGGCILPTEMLVENLETSTSTQVTIEGLEIGAQIDDRLFSAGTLESRDMLLGAPALR